MTDVAGLRTSLAALASPDGGWGYVIGQPTHPEPTSLALLALAGDPARFADHIAAGLLALESQSNGDGSYRWAHGRREAAWPTALALFVRAALGQRELENGIAKLKVMRGQVLGDDPEIADMMDINVKLIGWPWAEGNFSWVEPTAWAVLALRKAGAGECAEVADGVNLLLDRSFDEGGVNYGNRKVLGRMTEPIPTPTALMLLALQGYGHHPRIAAALRYLRSQAEQATDLEHLGWAQLALTAWRDSPEVGDSLARIEERIRKVLAEQAESPLIVRRALTCLALDADRYHPFMVDSGLSAHPTHSQNGNPTLPRDKSMVDRFASGMRGLIVNGLGALRQPPITSAVHIASAADYDADLVGVLRQQYEHFRAAVPLAGKRVVLKPNLVEFHKGKVINTDPRVVGAVIDLCRAEGASEVIVAEGPGHWRNVQFLVEESGLGEELRRRDVRFVDINHDEPLKLLNMGRLTGLDYLYLARTVVEAEVLVSLPKLKTHHWAGATLSLKNLFGTLPGTCYGWPKNELHWRGIPNSIVDIALTNTPHLAIVDGIIGMEGDGPLNGTAKPMGVLVMGTDLAAVDATCCRLMGIDPLRVPYLILARQKKLGRLAENEIPQLGEPIATRAKPFQMPPKIDKHLTAKPA